ncbi:hypothetical protein [Nocardia sp. CA-145437]|uniref:hypothetical protein n=1 Tax=Nocardia sp. CA-145437 TaxID=3239980 RepID=UPI003D969291
MHQISRRSAPRQRNRRTRFRLSAALAGILLTVPACSYGTETDSPTGFTSPPSCDDADRSLRSALRDYVPKLFQENRHLRTESSDFSGYSRSVRCELVLENPVPRTADVPAAGPLSRTIVINLDVSPPLSISTTMKPNRPDPWVTSTTPLPGVGEEALSWSGQQRPGYDEGGASARVGTLRMDVTLSGMDWSGGEAVPVWESRYLKPDLRSGAESLVTALAADLPRNLRRTTLTWPLPTPSTTSPPIEEPPMTVWDPCTIPDSSITAAGLDPASKKIGGYSLFDGKKACQWHKDDFDFSISAGSNRFLYAFFYPGFHTTFRPIGIGGRVGLSLPKESYSEHSCNLAFDAPRGEQAGAPVGVVEMVVSSWSDRNYSRDELCGKLFGIAGPLISQLPPGR